MRGANRQPAAATNTGSIHRILDAFTVSPSSAIPLGNANHGTLLRLFEVIASGISLGHGWGNSACWQSAAG
jgi:hypothetical protein